MTDQLNEAVDKQFFPFFLDRRDRDKWEPEVIGVAAAGKSNLFYINQ